MSNKLKGTVKTSTYIGRSEGFGKPVGFWFSSDIEDWQYGDSILGKERRRKAKEARRAQA